MAAPVKKRLALDTNLAFDLAANLAIAHEFREVCLDRGYSLWIPPTAVEELMYLSEEGEIARSSLAVKALTSLLSWKIQPFPLADLDRYLAKRFSRKLRDRGLLPEEEDNDGRILGETSAAQIPMLVTSDRHLLDIDARQLEIALADSDFSTIVSVVGPRPLLRILRGRH
jgi:hypothetical protein